LCPIAKASTTTCCVEADAAAQAFGKNLPFSGRAEEKLKKHSIIDQLLEALCHHAQVSNGSAIMISYKTHYILMGFGIFGRWISISGGTARAIILKKMEGIEKSFVQTQFESDQHERKIIVRAKATSLRFIHIDRTGSASNVGSFIIRSPMKIERQTVRFEFQT
jgi:hypothetical protein